MAHQFHLADLFEIIAALRHDLRHDLRCLIVAVAVDDVSGADANGSVLDTALLDKP